MSEFFRYQRALRCVTDGRVISIAQMAPHSARHHIYSGFAVLPPLLVGTALERLLPSAVSIVSPASGVVISVADGITLRTGDGITLTLHTGITEQLPEIGEKLRSGQQIMSVARSQLLQNGMDGAVAVIFGDSSRITELHVLSGRRRAGNRTAFYRIISS